MTTATHLSLPRPSLPDARLKDLDCLGFVEHFDPAPRARWITWAKAWRLADDLAERDLASIERAAAFLRYERCAWGPAEAPVLEAILADLCANGDGVEREEAWAAYLDALVDYHQPGLVIRTLAQHDAMLKRLSGPPVQLMPDMPLALWDAAAAFGALDQFYGNLRDVAEDAERGLCWLPVEALAEHGLKREDVIAGRAPEMRGWLPFIYGWIRCGSNYRRARVFMGAKLPLSVATMLTWTTRRYDRVAEAMRAVRYDYRRFPERYWAEVRREVGER